MPYEVRSIRLWSFLKVSFFLNILVGFLGGLFFAFITAFFISALGSMGTLSPYGFEMPQEFPLGFLFIIYPLMGALSCAIFLTLFELVIIGLYNAIAKVTGGFELNLNVVADENPTPQPIYAHTQMQQAVLPPPPPPPPARASTPPPSVAPTPPPPVEEPKPEVNFYVPRPAPAETTGRDQEPPDPEFPTRTVG